MMILMSLALTMPALAQYGRPYGYHRYAPPNASHYSRPATDVYYGLRLGVNF